MESRQSVCCCSISKSICPKPSWTQKPMRWPGKELNSISQSLKHPPGKMTINTLLELVCVLPAGAAEDGVLVLALPLMTETLRFWVTTPVKWGTRSLIFRYLPIVRLFSPLSHGHKSHWSERIPTPASYQVCGGKRRCRRKLLQGVGGDEVHLQPSIKCLFRN